MSYVWGSPDVKEVCEINGEMLELQTNVAQMVRRLRSVACTTRCWVDTVCINQTDWSEKQVQVALMPSVYHNASEVILWLGEESWCSAQGMDILSYLARDRAEANGPPPWRNMSPQLFRSGIEDIMARQWWLRGWVVQEFALSTKTRLVCGPNKVSWQAQTDRIREIIRNIKVAEISFEWRENGFSAASLQPFLDVLQEQLRQCEAADEEQVVGAKDQSSKSDIVDIMHDFRNKLFTDQRDRIYAVLGLVSNVTIQPDYAVTIREAWNILMRAIGRQPPTEEDSCRQDAKDEHGRKHTSLQSDHTANEVSHKTTTQVNLARQDDVAGFSQEMNNLRREVRDLKLQNADLENVNQTLWERLKAAELANKKR